MIKNEILFPLHVVFDEKFMTNLQFVVEYFMKYYYDYFEMFLWSFWIVFYIHTFSAIKTQYFYFCTIKLLNLNLLSTIRHRIFQVTVPS